MWSKEQRHKLEAYANNEYDGDMIKLAQKINKTFVSVSQDLNPLESLSYTQYDNLPDELIITVDSVEKQLLHTKLGTRQLDLIKCQTGS